MRPSLRYAKIVLCLAVVLFLILFLLDKFYTPPPSFYYRLYVTNTSSNDFIFVRLVQLTDIMARNHDLPSTSQVVAKNATKLLRIPGECDSPDTLFVVLAYPSTASGEQLDIPLKCAYFDLIPFSNFQANAFDSSLTDIKDEKVHVDISDASFKPVTDYVRKFESTLQEEDLSRRSVH